MPVSATAAAEAVLREFEGPWRDHTPVFGCCRRAIEAAVAHGDVVETATLDVTARVQALRAAVERELPGHLASHRCCSGHIADLAFDLPDLLAPAAHAEDA
jgi:hypothetical protein